MSKGLRAHRYACDLALICAFFRKVPVIEKLCSGRSESLHETSVSHVWRTKVALTSKNKDHVGTLANLEICFGVGILTWLASSMNAYSPGASTELGSVMKGNQMERIDGPRRA